MDLIRELSNLERRVSFEQLVNIEQLSTRDMDINEFILCNFVVQNGPAFEMNYAKIASTLPQLQQIQQRTCEDIALSVDLNLDQYVQISEKLQGLRDTLSHLQDRYSSVENDIEITKEALQEKIYQINAILENLKLINKLDSNMNVLKQLLKKMHQLNDSLPQITQEGSIGSQTLGFCYLLIQTRDQYQYQIDTCVHCRQLCQRFQIINQLNHLNSVIVNYLEQQCVARLLQNGDPNELALIIQCFIVLQQPKLPEKIIVQFILKPHLDRSYQDLLKNKTALLKNESILEKFAQQVMEIYQIHGQPLEATLALLPSCPFSFKQMLIELVYIYLSQKECAFVYSVGVPETFLRNYNTLLGLRAKLAIEKTPDLEKKFYEKWNLNSYFSLRYNQIVKSFEQGLDEQLKSLQKHLAEGAPAVLLKHVYSCVSPTVFIKGIASKFIKLIIQLVIRFCQLIQDLKSTLNDEQSSLSNDIAVNLCEAWKELPDLLDTLREQCGEMKQLQDLLSTKLFNLTSQFIDLTIIPITNQCYQNLEPFNGIPAKFRMTNRDLPTQPSNFTGNIFRPLQTFLGKTSLHQSLQELIILKITQQVQIRFTQIKENVLEGCSKQEQLMQKLGVKKEATAITDYQKITRQFELDTEELGAIIQRRLEIQSV